VRAEGRVLARAAGTLALLAGPALGTASADWVRLDTPRATLYYEESALSRAQAERFSSLLDRGIGDIESYLGPAAPRALREGRIVYHVGQDVPFSVTRGRNVSLMAERVRSDSAPYLHETVHALVPAPHRSVWLSEGFASYVESYVSENIGGYDAHVFSKAGNRGVDAEAARWLARERGQAVLPFIGAPGEPPEMREERRRVAAPFYVLAQSFSKFLVQRMGLGPVMEAVSSRDPEAALQRASGRAVEEWKAEWLRALRPGAV
jgi:hypothetical protein